MRSRRASGYGVWVNASCVTERPEPCPSTVARTASTPSSEVPDMRPAMREGASVRREERASITAAVGLRVGVGSVLVLRLLPHLRSLLSKLLRPVGLLLGQGVVDARGLAVLSLLLIDAGERFGDEVVGLVVLQVGRRGVGGVGVGIDAGRFEFVDEMVEVVVRGFVRQVLDALLWGLGRIGGIGRGRRARKAGARAAAARLFLGP